MGGQSSKQIFGDIIQQLLASDIDSSNHEFWDTLWKSSLTVN